VHGNEYHKMSGALTPPTPQHDFVAWCLTKHMGRVTFTLFWTFDQRTSNFGSEELR